MKTTTWLIWGSGWAMAFGAIFIFHGVWHIHPRVNETAFGLFNLVIGIVMYLVACNRIDREGRNG